MCIRCGECFKACPNNVLQPEGFQQGLEGLWTPEVVADWAGCESSCNACGQVCPTGAIRAVASGGEEGRPHGAGDRQRTNLFALCRTSETATCASKNATLPVITRSSTSRSARKSMIRAVRSKDQACSHRSCSPISASAAAYAKPDVTQSTSRKKACLGASAIIVEAGAGKEDRLMDGSYIQLRAEREAVPSAGVQGERPDSPLADPEISQDQNPFGL